jgi:hypothetical protein
LLLALTLVALPLLVLGQSGLPTGLDMTDNGSNTLSSGRLSGVGGVMTVSGGPALLPDVRSSGQLTREDFRKVYREAMGFYETGRDFRAENLSFALKCSNVEECLQNYTDFNANEIYFKFCDNYDPAAINASGACDTSAQASEKPIASRSIRTQLVYSRDMFGFLAAQAPVDLTDRDAGGQLLRDLGATGMLSATTEIANIHLIFGNEFIVDALRYRYSGGDPRADAIVTEELRLLEEARQQFSLGLDSMVYAFNADLGGVPPVFAADFFGEREFDLFATLSERLIVALKETAIRHRAMFGEQRALQTYNSAFDEQYVQFLALTTRAKARNLNFLEMGGWRLMNNMEQLRVQAQAITNGLNQFGYSADYVPLQTYAEMRDVTLSFIADSESLERDLYTEGRNFEEERDRYRAEMLAIQTTYNNRLLEICGPQNDYARNCTSGLMERNYLDALDALDRIALANEAINNNLAAIEDEQTKADTIIDLTLLGGGQLSLAEYARGIILSQRTSEIVIDGTSREVYGGIETALEKSVSVNPLACGLGACDAKLSITLRSGVKWAQTTTSQTQTTVEASQLELGQLNSELAINQAANQAQIISAESEARVRELMRNQATLLIDRNLALRQWDRVAAEKNQLAAEYGQWLNLRSTAEQNLAESRLANPVNRIVVDQLTIKAAQAHSIAAQYAYLTAKALEYELLKPIPTLSDVFKARTFRDLRDFMGSLERIRLAEQRVYTQFPYRISVAKDILGFTDQNRRVEFPKYLQQNIIRDPDSGAPIAVEFSFITSLQDNRLFNQRLWNNRIAGVGEPRDRNGNLDPRFQGVRVNLLSSQFGLTDAPSIELSHGGQATYRTSDNRLVFYSPANARPSGYIPITNQQASRTDVFQASINNGTLRGTSSRVFYNLSVAAARWTVRIDLTSRENRNLDLTKIEDIELLLDSFGFSLGGNAENSEVQPDTTNEQDPIPTTEPTMEYDQEVITP